MPLWVFKNEPCHADNLFLHLNMVNHLEVNMSFWKRFLITVVSMLVISVIVGVIWRSSFIMVMPSYLSGVVGGLAALPVWELLKRIKPKKK